MLRTKFVTVMTGMTSEAPEDTLLTVALIEAERSFGTTTAFTPAPSATRKQAPKLCGSVIPSKIKNKGFCCSPSRSSITSVMVRAIVIFSAKATTP